MEIKSRNTKNSKNIQGIQQVSALYSEHIYRSNQKNFVYETELEKYRIMYENEKKEKRKLIKDIIQLKEKQQKMEGQREIFSFALDTLTCKLDEDTVEKSKNLLGHLDENQSVDGDNDKFQKKKNMKASKMKLIKYLKENFQLSQNTSSKNSPRGSKDQVFMDSSKVKEMQDEISTLKIDLRMAKGIIQEKEEEIQDRQGKISELQLVNGVIERKKKEKEEQIAELNEKMQELKEEMNEIEAKFEKLQSRNTQLENELKITHQTYQEREEKEKQCVKVLQNFSKQLKVNDQKMRQFLKDQFPDYCSDVVSSSSQAYQEHLSYILHLYKKKENLYEDVLEEMKKMMRESDLRAIVMEKKLNSFYEYNKHLIKIMNEEKQEEKCIKSMKNTISNFNK